MRLHHVLATILITFFCTQAYAGELPNEAQKMLDDLGATSMQQKNNGKLFRCLHGGTKRVSVSTLGDAVIFTGDYNYCREPGSMRDGFYEIMVRNGEIIGKSSKQSINGELFDAVQNDDIVKVRDLVERKADVNYFENISGGDQKKIDGWTPLMWAASKGNFEMVTLLLKSGAWINYLNSDVLNAVWIASANGHLGTVKKLVANRAFINNRNIEDVTPLMVAAMRGHHDVVKYLLDSKADINFVHKEGDSALMFALAHRHTNIAGLLIDYGADINIRNRFGVTALIIAAAEGNEEITRILLDKKADITPKTESGMTALDIAVAKGYSKIEKLIKHAQSSE
ncbi:MAG: ankyrin repeat domain-containing protein [Steroidobacteraceae bacterium]|nr:ankyrin repeat domain-containing protein [Deltaproteobacteria bacterium]